MVKKNVAKSIFCLVFLAFLYFRISDIGNSTLMSWLELFPLALLILFSFCKRESKITRFLFAFFAILDFSSGLSYFMKNIAVKNFFLFFPSSSWMFSLIYIFKYQQHELFKSFLISAFLWVGYIFEWLSFRKTDASAEINKKKITISSVAAFINLLILILTVVIIFNNNWVNMELTVSRLSYKKVYTVMVFNFLCQSAIPSILLAAIGLIGERLSKAKNLFGKITNEVLLVFYILSICCGLIVVSVWVNNGNF